MAKYSRLDFKTALPQIEKDMDEREKIVDKRFDGLLDFFYPVGTIYETADVNFNPNETWGGTWEKIKGRVLVGLDSDDTYFDTVGETGGNKGMFAHNHSSVSKVGYLRIRRMSNDSNILDNIYGKDNICSYAGKSAGTAWGRTITSTSTDGKPDLVTIDASHTHNTEGDINNTDANIGNMPPYEVVVIWKRTS